MSAFRATLSLPCRPVVPVSFYLFPCDSFLGTDRVISLYARLVTHGRYFSKFDFTYGRATVYKEACTRRIETSNPPATVYPSKLATGTPSQLPTPPLPKTPYCDFATLRFPATAFYCVCDCDCDCDSALLRSLCDFACSVPCVRSVRTVYVPSSLLPPGSRSSVVPTDCVRVFRGSLVLVRGSDQS